MELTQLSMHLQEWTLCDKTASPWDWDTPLSLCPASDDAASSASAVRIGQREKGLRGEVTWLETAPRDNAFFRSGEWDVSLRLGSSELACALVQKSLGLFVPAARCAGIAAQSELVERCLCAT